MFSEPLRFEASCQLLFRQRTGSGTQPAIQSVPDAAGRFGPFGGRYVPETLTRALDELTVEYAKAQRDPAFQAELDDLLHRFVGRPSPLYHAKRLSQKLGGGQIWLKREDLNHTGAHKINNTLGQALLTLRMGKSRVIAETGAGNTVLPPLPLVPTLGFPVSSIWGPKMYAVNNRMSSTCG